LKAHDPRLCRNVASKVLLPHLAANAMARQRFLNEARKQAAVSHNHVVAIHAVDEADGYPFIVMEYVVGTTLQERIKRTGPLKLEEILRIGLQAASGLAAAHDQGLVHRDIKPANIFLENGVERVKIADFGLARAADDLPITHSDAVAGTPEYMSPEQTRTRSNALTLDPPTVRTSTKLELEGCCGSEWQPWESAASRVRQTLRRFKLSAGEA
jgi:serine/threonine-protein kinase